MTLSLSDGVVKGKLLAIDPDVLLVGTAAGERRVPFSAVNEARRKRTGIALGTIIGAAAGVVPGVLAAILTANEGGEATGVVLLNVGAGAAIGWHRRVA